MPGFYDTWPNRLKRPLYGLQSRLKDRYLDWMESRGAFEHLFGPEEVGPGPVVLCLVRDGELWIESFVRHHLDLGARHIFFLDNGSTDSTVDRARAHDRVSMWRTELPFGRYELAFRRWLMRRFGAGRWCLICDIDELFDYPFSRDLPLAGFLDYLERHSYQVVAAQMLDMFSAQPFSELTSRPGDRLEEKYPYYDISDVTRRRDIYWIDDSRPDHDDLFCTFGGIRGREFGSEGLLQTKHPLVFAGEDVRVLHYDGHFSVGEVADVSGVLLHYKFLSNLYDYAREALEEGQHWDDSAHYRGFYEVLGEDPDLTLHGPGARRLERTEQLLEEEFLTASDRYVRWVKEHSEARSR